MLQVILLLMAALCHGRDIFNRPGVETGRAYGFDLGSAPANADPVYVSLLCITSVDSHNRNRGSTKLRFITILDIR